MARPLTYVPVPVQLRRSLEESRELGLDFIDAWERAVRRHRRPVVTTNTPIELRPPGAIAWPADTDERRSWLRVTVAMRETWRRAYELAPPIGPEAAARLLWGELDPSQPHERLEALPTEHVNAAA